MKRGVAAMRSPTRAGFLRALVFAAAAAAVGCATLPVSETGVAPPARPASMDDALAEVLNRLLPAKALREEFVLEQRVTIHWNAESGVEQESFDAALQRRGDSLLLVGFGPMQRVGFELELSGGRIDFRNRTGRAMPFRPEDILADVQRVFYPWIDSRPAGERAEEKEPCRSCERRAESQGFDILERWEGGLRVQRVFQRIDRPDLGRIQIDYIGQLRITDDSTASHPAIAQQIRLRNEWFGYEMEIVNLRFDPIR
jgi:hypothetical protein